MQGSWQPSNRAMEDIDCTTQPNAFTCTPPPNEQEPEDDLLAQWNAPDSSSDDEEYTSTCLRRWEGDVYSVFPRGIDGYLMEQVNSSVWSPVPISSPFKRHCATPNPPVRFIGTPTPSTRFRSNVVFHSCPTIRAIYWLPRRNRIRDKFSSTEIKFYLNHHDGKQHLCGLAAQNADASLILIRCPDFGASFDVLLTLG